MLWGVGAAEGTGGGKQSGPARCRRRPVAILTGKERTGGLQPNTGKGVKSNRSVRLTAQPRTTTGRPSRPAGATGTFQFPGVALSPGANPFTARATNRFGDSADFSVTITRLPRGQQPNAVLVWNQALLEAIRQDATPPPAASRALALVQDRSH